MTVRSEGDLRTQELLVTLGVAVVVLVALVVAGVAQPEPMPPPVSAPVPSIRFEPANAPIAVYTDRDRTLTVSPSAPRDLLICIRDRCDLAEGWIGK